MKHRRRVHSIFGGVVFLIVAAGPAVGRDGPEHDASNALKGLEVHADLEATLFASEPMIVNPTNVDVDARAWLSAS